MTTLRKISGPWFRFTHGPHGLVVHRPITADLVRMECPCGHFIEGHPTEMRTEEVEFQLQGRCDEC